MSLEENILDLTIAIQQLTNVLRSQNAPAGSINWMHQNAKVYAAAQRDATGSLVKADAATHEAIINEKTEVPNDPAEELKKSSPTTDTSLPTSQASVSYDDVKAVTIAVSKMDKAKAVAGLARFGAKNAKELQETQWRDYVDYMTKVHEGEIDPESSHES